MVPSFSTGEKVQVEYSISPPGFSMEMADETHSRWSLAKNAGLVSSQVLATAGSFLNIPSPEQGASTSILSKNSGMDFARDAGTSLVIKEFGIPHSSIFRCRALARELLISWQPAYLYVPFRRQALWPFHPGRHRGPAHSLRV